MSTAEMLRTAGFWPVLLVLALAFAVLLLRLAALPLAGAALALDALADAAARPIAGPPADTTGTGVRR